MMRRPDSESASPLWGDVRDAMEIVGVASPKEYLFVQLIERNNAEDAMLRMLRLLVSPVNFYQRF